MSGHKMTLIADEDVPFMPLVKALAKAGLTLSNLPGSGFDFRIHQAETVAAQAQRAARPPMLEFDPGITDAGTPL